jgi:pyruvate-ferredoxin/flavodoxin oxidoreductase
MQRRICADGNEAAARVAYALSEAIAIYPITPASPMGELSDAWAAAGRANVWGSVPRVIEMQSEAGAAGALHGALLRGTLATTFTASQGLLLMLPNMLKIAGELTPAVIHVAARSLATHALSIFGDHSDVMAARTTGWALLASGSVQEAQDLAAVAHAATLRSRVPFLHFFDGFRTSHELLTIEALDDDDLTALVDEADVLAHRARGLTPSAPTIRGTAQNPDVFFQAREAANPSYAEVPRIVAQTMAALAERTGRRYGLVDYRGHPEAERVAVLMGSGAGAMAEAVEELVRRGERVGMLQVRLYRPFPVEALLSALPATARGIVVLDRTKEPGAQAEPLLADVTTALALRAAGSGRTLPRVIGGRYGLSSKEFTPAMAAAALAELDAPAPTSPFTLGIVDDVTHTSLTPVAGFAARRPAAGVQAVFYGLGADGTVGANKHTVKIVADRTPLHAQGYFVYDSKKSGAVTVSHLRFSPEPIRSTYLVEDASADIVAIHQLGFLGRRDMLSVAAPGASVLLNVPWSAEEAFDALPADVQQAIVDKGLRVFVVDAYRLAREEGLGARINTVMQPCFFALAGILPVDEAIEAVKASIVEAYGKRGEEVVRRNIAVVDRALKELAEVPVPTAPSRRMEADVASLVGGAPDFVQRVTARIMAGEGELLPVSALPVDGTFPTGTACYERRSIAREIPIWDPQICIDCGKCAVVCPHSAIRLSVFDPAQLAEGAVTPSKPYRSKDLPGMALTVQVAPDDCTGCGVCVEVCPARDKTAVGHKAIDMEPIEAHLDAERERWEAFLELEPADLSAIGDHTVKAASVRQPLFEFSGACAGCGETPYLGLLSRLFGDRMVVANATGCSSIYGGNLPTTPWTTDAEGRGPAWANSLFEDNAEFGLGLRIGYEQQADLARRLLDEHRDDLGEGLVLGLLDADQTGRDGIAAQRVRVAALRERLAAFDEPWAARLDAVAESLVEISLWIVGGDGWAYDIGYGGLDHVLASGLDVNVLVLDTEVYSNTGGQASKATPRGSVAKFATAGKASPKKDLGLLAIQYGDVYVGQIAMGANDAHTLKVLHEAAAHPGPSLVLAYSTCIAHGIDMRDSMAHQRDAVRSGHWPLYRYQPAQADDAPFSLDSARPTLPIAEFALREGRFAMLARSDPERARRLLEAAQEDVDERWRYYEQLAGVARHAHAELDDSAPDPTTDSTAGARR